jgi:hypothetical protein
MFVIGNLSTLIDGAKPFREAGGNLWGQMELALSLFLSRRRR